MAKLEILQESESLSHANVSIHLEAHVSNRPSRIRVSDDILRYHVQSRLLVGGGSDDADGKGEKEGDCTSKQNTPPWQLKSALIMGAGNNNHNNINYEDN